MGCMHSVNVLSSGPYFRVAATKVGTVAVALQNLGLLYNLGICMDDTATC